MAGFISVLALGAVGFVSVPPAASGPFPPAVAACVQAKLGAAAAGLVDGTRAPTAAESSAVGACYSEAAGGGQGGGPATSVGAKATQAGGAITESMLACVKAKLGAKVATAITTTRAPTAAEATVIGACASSGGAPKPSAQTKATPAGTKATVGKPAPARVGCLSAAALVERALADEREHPIPTAAEIACNAKKAKRKPLAPVMVTTVPDPDGQDYPGADVHGVAGKTIHAIRTRIEKEGFPADFGVHGKQGLPPWENMLVDSEALRQALRLYQAVVLADKAAGKPAYFVFTLAGPGSWEATVGQTEVSFRAWVEKTVEPRIALVAKAAEEVKAEVLVVPFEIEPDILLNTGKLQQLPPATRVELAQLLVTAGLETARRHFKGQIAAWRGWQFHAPNEEIAALFAAIPMGDVSYKGYDLMLATFFASHPKACTAQYARDYMAAQLAKTIELAQRDGVRWGIHEFEVLTLWSHKQYGDCGESDLRAAHDAVLEIALDAVATASVRPALVALMAGPAEWQADAAFRQRLGKRLAAFARALKQG